MVPSNLRSAQTPLFTRSISRNLVAKIAVIENSAKGEGGWAAAAVGPGAEVVDGPVEVAGIRAAEVEAVPAEASGTPTNRAPTARKSWSGFRKKQVDASLRSRRKRLWAKSIRASSRN